MKFYGQVLKASIRRMQGCAVEGRGKSVECGGTDYEDGLIRCGDAKRCGNEDWLVSCHLDLPRFSRRSLGMQGSAWKEARVENSEPGTGPRGTSRGREAGVAVETRNAVESQRHLGLVR